MWVESVRVVIGWKTAGGGVRAGGCVGKGVGEEEFS